MALLQTKLVVFDMDGVLADTESSWAFVNRHFGVDDSPNVGRFFRGEIDEPTFMRGAITLWMAAKPGLRGSEVAELLAQVPPMRGAEEALETLRSRGCHLAIVSAGLDGLAGRLGKDLGLHTVLANGLEEDGAGALTGDGILRVSLADKGLAVRRLQEELGVSQAHTASVGNSFSDIPMFHAAGRSVAFCPLDSEVRRAAHVVIEERDLRATLPHIP